MKRMHWHLKIPPLTPHNINKPYVFRSTYDSYHRQLHSYCNDWPHILSKRLVLNFPIRFKWIPSTKTQLIFDLSEFNDSTTTTTTAIMHDYWFMDNESKLCRVNMQNKDFFGKQNFNVNIFFVFIRLICIRESWIQDCSSGFFPHFFQNFIKITKITLFKTDEYFDFGVLYVRKRNWDNGEAQIARDQKLSMVECIYQFLLETCQLSN